MATNKLFSYLFQCRSEEFIERFYQNNCASCSQGISNLYACSYALHVILKDDSWGEHIRPTIEICRKGCDEILSFLASKTEIPKDYETTFKDFVRSRYQWNEEEDDFEWMLDGDIEKLREQGYREIDCYLYEAGMKLHYDRVIELLERGADPYVSISADVIASEAESHLYDTYRLYEKVGIIIDDSFFYGVEPIIKKGVQKIDVEIHESIIQSVFQTAAYLIMLKMIDTFEKSKKNRLRPFL